VRERERDKEREHMEERERITGREREQLKSDLSNVNNCLI
jgi:hypothetical protein